MKKCSIGKRTFKFYNTDKTYEAYAIEIDNVVIKIKIDERDKSLLEYLLNK